MSQTESKKTLNRMNNLSLQEKRGFREIIDGIYTDLVDTNTFVGGDYYQSRHSASTAYTIDNVLGYETGLTEPITTSGDVFNGFVATDGSVARTITAAATADGGASVVYTTSGIHGLAVGDLVQLSGFAGDEEYNGAYYVTETALTNTFKVTETFTADLAGVLTKPSILTCATAGTYFFNHQGRLETTSVAGNGSFKCYKNDAIQSSQGRYSMDTAGANLESPYSYSWALTLAVGDTVHLAVTSAAWGATIILRNATLTVQQVA